MLVSSSKEILAHQSSIPAIKETKGECAPESPGATITTAQPAVEAISVSFLE